MEYRSIDDVFAQNDQIAKQFEAFVSGLSAHEIYLASDGGWSIAQIVEHVSAVDAAVARICTKLLGKAEADGASSSGGLSVSPDFIARSREMANVRLEAPDSVRPVGDRSPAESLARMEENQKRFAEMRPRFEKFGSSDYTFPHPFLGEMSAVEWLILAGWHKSRHRGQIEALIENGRKAAGDPAISEGTRDRL